MAKRPPTKPRARPAAKAKPPSALPPFRYLQTRVSEETWEALSLLALREKTKLQTLAIEAFNLLLRSRGQREIARGPE